LFTQFSAKNSTSEPLGGTFQTFGSQIGFEVPSFLLQTAPEIRFEPENNVLVIEENKVLQDDNITLKFSGGPKIEGSPENTEFIFSLNTFGTGTDTVTISDVGGGSDRITFGDLDGVLVKISDLSTDFVEIDIIDNDGGTFSTETPLPNVTNKLHVSRDVELLQGSLSDLNSGFTLNNALVNITTGKIETAYILAGSTGVDSITLEDTNAFGALLFGLSGDDEFILSGASTDHVIRGGEGTDTVDYNKMLTFNGMAEFVRFDFKSGVISATHTGSSDTFDGIEHVIASAKDDFLNLKGADATGSLLTVSGGDGEEKFLFNGGMSTTATINGGNGDDSYLFTGLPSDAITIGDFTTGADTLVFNLQGNTFLGHDTASTNGGILAASFFNGTEAAQDDDFFIYDGDNLFYDADGSGTASSQVKVAVVGAGLAATDIRFADVLDVSGSVTATITNGAGLATVVLASDKDDVITLSGTVEDGDVFDGLGGSDTLNLANGTNTLTVFDTETVNGGTGDDNITLFGLDGSAVTGGNGSDKIILSGGSDIIRYNQSAEGGDTVNGFVSGTDSFSFDLSNFLSTESKNILDEAAFVSGVDVTAVGGEDRFIFDTGTKILSFDDDGNDGNAAVVIATLDNDSLKFTDITFF
jgi:hypothetical protein